MSAGSFRIILDPDVRRPEARQCHLDGAVALQPNRYLHRDGFPVFADLHANATTNPLPTVMQSRLARDCNENETDGRQIFYDLMPHENILRTIRDSFLKTTPLGLESLRNVTVFYPSLSQSRLREA
jgi:hypothetical protein